MNRIALAASLALATFVFSATPACADPIRYWNQNAELTIGQVSPKTVRVHFAPLDDKGVPRKGVPSTVMADYPHEIKLRLREIDGGIATQIGGLFVGVKLNPLTITIHSFQVLVQELVINEVDGTMEFRTSAPVLGLGEGDVQFDRRGSTFRSQLVNGQVQPLLNTHGATIRVPFLIGTDGWAMFVHRPFAEFDLRDKTNGKVVPIKGAKGTEPLEVFVTYAPEPAIALSEYIVLTGKPVMPPKWTMGYMQSHRTLAGPKEPVEIVKTFREKKLPLDAVIYLGTGYAPLGWNTANGTIDFNPKSFDDPPQNIKALNDENVKVILHVNKAPKGMHGNSVHEKSESSIHISNYWAWQIPVFNLGIAGWWPDDGDELPVEARMARHRCYYEGPLMTRPNERPWSLHRNGYAGVQRYGGWIWSGDPQSKWATLAAHVPVGVNASLSLTPFWGTDIGGFVMAKEYTGELYTRWFQFGTFNPLMRSHGRTWKTHLPWGWNLGGPQPLGESPATSFADKSEFLNAEVEPICKKYLELRYQLLPYNYSLMREAHDVGLPMRAMWLHYPTDPEAVKLGNQYLWGRDMLVAPVAEKGAKERSVYLPQGDWYDWWTGEKQTGKRAIKRSVDLATMPIYVRAGAIIPLDPVRQFTAQPVSEPTMLKVYPGANGQISLYDDDGKSLDYLGGKRTWTKITWDDAKRVLVIEPEDRAGGTFQLQPRVFNVVTMHDMKEQRVNYAGTRVEVKF